MRNVYANNKGQNQPARPSIGQRIRNAMRRIGGRPGTRRQG